MSRHEFAAGEELSSDKLNKNIIAGSYDAGETINGETLPVPCYQNTSDNEFYKCDANVSTKLEFTGFAISNSTNGNPIDLQFNGIVRGFTGLQEGRKYYVQDTAGTIGTAKGTYEILVGIAVSTTELLILKDEKMLLADASDDTGGTENICAEANTQRDIVTTTYAKHKEIRIARAGIYRVYFGVYHNSSSFATYGKVYKNGVAIGTERSAGSTVWVYYYQDFTFAIGDLVQLYGKLGDISYTGKIGFFKLQAILIPVAVTITD